MNNAPTLENQEKKAEAAEAPFDITEALNTKGFVEFLAEYDDAEEFDMEDAEAVHLRFEAFQGRDEAAEKMNELFRTELKSQNLGLKLGDKDLDKHVGARMRELATENPEKMLEALEALREFNSLATEIGEVEARIKELREKGDLEQSIEELKRKEQVLEDAAETTKFFGGSGRLTGFFAAYEKFAFGDSVEFAKEFLASGKEMPSFTSKEEKEKFIQERSSDRRAYAARKMVKDGYGIDLNTKAIKAELENVRSEIQTKAAQIETLKLLEQGFEYGKNRLGEVREYILSATDASEAIRALAVTKAQEKLSGLLDSDPDKAQEFFESLMKASEENSLDIDYIKDDAEDIQALIDEQVEKQIVEDMAKTIAKAKLGDKAYDKLAESLGAFIGRQKAGSKEGAEAQDFVFDALASIAKDLAKTDKPRAILAKALLSKLSLQRI